MNYNTVSRPMHDTHTAHIIFYAMTFLNLGWATSTEATINITAQTNIFPKLAT